MQKMRSKKKAQIVSTNQLAPMKRKIVNRNKISLKNLLVLLQVKREPHLTLKTRLILKVILTKR